MLVYRISKSIYANTLTASGRQNRWNSGGKYVLYTASSLSLACLETLVHTSGELLYSDKYKSVIIEISEGISATIVDLKKLPENWQQREQKSYTQEIGDDWINKKETLLLRVPSAIINREYNYLINTNHPEFARVFINEVDNFMFDKRIKG